MKEIYGLVLLGLLASTSIVCATEDTTTAVLKGLGCSYEDPTARTHGVTSPQPGATATDEQKLAVATQLLWLLTLLQRQQALMTMKPQKER